MLRTIGAAAEYRVVGKRGGQPSDDELLGPRVHARASKQTVKALHVLQIRAAIDTVRVARQLPLFAWTDAVLTPAVTQVASIHLAQLRSALNAAYEAANKPLPTYPNPSIGPGTTIIRAIDLTELQSAVIALQ